MMKKLSKKNIFSVVIVIFVTLFILFINAFYTEQNLQWAQSLILPYCQPPVWTFYITWIILYILIAISAIIILNERKTQKNKCNQSIILFLITAFLTGLYSILFFGFKNILFAFLELPFLLAAIILLIWCTYKVSKTAAYLLIPYLVWVAYATVFTGLMLYVN